MSQASERIAFSAVIPAYNREAVIGRAIESALAQSEPPVWVASSVTSRPMKNGTSVSSTATVPTTGNMAAKGPFAWRMKCQ